MNPLPWLCLALGLSTCQSSAPTQTAAVEAPVSGVDAPGASTPGTKMGGVSFVAPRQAIDSATMGAMKRVNANWVALIPYAMVGREGGTQLHYNHPRQEWGETHQGVAECANLAHRQGLKVMVKPQVWLHRGTYTGHFLLENEGEWRAFEAQYRDYILGFARVSDSLGVEVFCLGTEFDGFVEKRPHFWKTLIADVRGVFHGKLTYAANWNSYRAFPHWQALDFVGVNAYFPLCPRDTPTAATLDEHWKPWVREVETFQRKQKKPILFTEYGYRSLDGCAKEPWESGRDATANPEAQRLSYEALYRQFWQKPWVAGGFLWKWYERDQLAEGDSRWFRRQTDYTPQGKPVEATIREWYGKKNAEF